MIKRLFMSCVSLVLILSLNGCWNYRSLDQLSLIVGIAVDFDKEKNLFNISYESANLAGAEKQGRIAGKVIHSEGKTLFDAARNAKRKEEDKLFFGASHVLVLNQDLVREEGILNIIEWFLRDAECRETVCVAISQEKTAEEILESPEEMKSIMSLTIHDILKEDKDVTGTSPNTKLYEIYNMLYSPRKSAIVPVLRMGKNGEEDVPEVNGAAVIKGEYLVGFLSPEQSRYVLMVENQLSKGLITLSTTDMLGDDLSLEILKCRSKKSYSYESGKMIVKIETTTDVSVAENRANLDMMDKQVIRGIEETAAAKIDQGIKNLVDTLQHELNTDIFGFGEMIYKKDFSLWQQISPGWDELYPSVEVQVSSTVNITSAASVM